MDLELAGQRVLVTGGSKGIGLACAQAFAAAGATPILAARDADALEAAAASLPGVAAGTEVVACDLARPEDRVALHAAHPDVDVLVNNAGAIPGGSLFDIDLARWQAAWALKVFGYIHLTQLYLETMKARGAGVIVNVIGMASRAPRWDYVVGGTGNAALVAFTQAVGGRSPSFGVRVVGINPAVTRTERMVAQARGRAERQFGDANRWEETLVDLPLGRPAQPEEIGALAAYLASPRAGYVSGTVIDVDGGGSNR